MFSLSAESHLRPCRHRSHSALARPLRNCTGNATAAGESCEVDDGTPCPEGCTSDVVSAAVEEACFATDAPLTFVPDIGAFFCECSDYFSGEFCNGTEGLLNPCHPSHLTGNNCDGNATCLYNASDPGNFTCACEPGYLDLGGAVEGNCTDINEW